MQKSDIAEVVEKTRGRGRPRIYPFDEIQPGEFRVIAGKTRDQIAPSLAAAERRTGAVFFTFPGPGGVRVGRPTLDQEEAHKQIRAARKARREERRRLRGGSSAMSPAEASTNNSAHS